jgi:hypothetical protein
MARPSREEFPFALAGGKLLRGRLVAPRGKTPRGTPLGDERGDVGLARERLLDPTRPEAICGGLFNLCVFYSNSWTALEGVPIDAWRLAHRAYVATKMPSFKVSARVIAGHVVETVAIWGKRIHGRDTGKSILT